eukprot:scaffold43511_cov57-Phaeocystis_antarctica.AAC.3
MGQLLVLPGHGLGHPRDGVLVQAGPVRTYDGRETHEQHHDGRHRTPPLKNLHCTRSRYLLQRSSPDIHAVFLRDVHPVAPNHTEGRVELCHVRERPVDAVLTRRVRVDRQPG